MGKGIKKLAVLLLIFIAAVGAIMWVRRDSEKTKSYAEMETASLPVMKLIYQGRAVNELHGYTAGLEAGTVRETIYPLSEDRTISVRLETFGGRVTAVGYEVRSLDGGHLIERNQTDALDRTDGDIATAEIVLMDLLDKGEQYLVTFTLYNDDNELASYYTRVRAADEDILPGAIDFALDFSDKTFLDEPDEVIIAQLESKPGADNSDLGYTDIYSSYNHVLWGELNPERSGEISVSLCEFDRLMTTLSLSYSVTAGGDAGEQEYYEVKEYYCVRYVNGKYYLMTYERTVNQRFPHGDVIGEDGSLFLGVTGADRLSLQACRAGNYTAFVQDKTLRCYDKAKDCLRTLFTFNSGEDDVRTDYDQHDIRIVRLSDSGDLEFLVYGYMNRGTHQGESGIAYYRYQAKEDALEEMFYIASDRNYQRLKEELGTLSYMNDNGLFYLMYDRTVYAVDIDSGEYVELASGLGSENLSVDGKNGVVAWQKSGSEGEEGKITLYFLESGESRVISTPDGETAKMIGFINGDLLYGLVRDADMAGTSPYSEESPIHALEIVNTGGEVVSHYEQAGIYLTDIEIMEDRICFGRRQRINGVWEKLEDDILLCSEETENQQAVLLKASSSARQKRVYSLALNLTDKTSVIRKNPVFLENQPERLAFGSAGEREGELYYAYSYGKLQGIFDTVADAIACIEPDMGVVTDEDQKMIWNRGNRGAAAQVTMPKTEPM